MTRKIYASTKREEKLLLRSSELKIQTGYRLYKKSPDHDRSGLFYF